MEDDDLASLQSQVCQLSTNMRDAMKGVGVMTNLLDKVEESEVKLLVDQIKRVYGIKLKKKTVTNPDKHLG